MKKLFLFFLFIGVLTFFQSCEKDQITTDNFEALGAPELPSPEIFDLSLSEFDGAKDDGPQAKSMTRWHWLHAGTNILVWNTVVVVNLAVPVTALGAAFNEEVEYLGGGVYEWKYDFDRAEETIEVKITGAYRSTEDEIDWRMTLSPVGSDEEFVWLTGFTTPFESEYILYHQIENPEPYLLLNYQENPDNPEEKTTRFTNIIPEDEANGHYIEYRATPNAPYNRGYDVFQSDEDFLEIQLNEPAGDGRVRHPINYGDDEWRCWDEEKRDVEC